MLGKILGGRYVVGDVIGRGGMGVVHVADDLSRAERVAIKVLHTAADPIEYELRVGFACRHPNVVSVLDSGTVDGRPFVVMEHVDGRSLGLIAGDDPRPTLPRIASLAGQLLDGLDAIHRAGYIHGDLKSDNVLVAGDVVKIIDFGLARPHHAAREDDDDGTISGTPDYIAPEVVDGEPKSVASDLYAVGVILYELLTGTTPFAGGSSCEILRRHVEDPVVPPSLRSARLRLSLTFERVVMRALEKQPSARYRDAAAFTRALAAASRTAWSNTDSDVLSRAATKEWKPSLDPDEVVVAALETAKLRIAEHRWLVAASELETALEILDEERRGGASAWRLLLPLAAVYDGLGDPRRARKTAREALESATRTGCDLGQERAKALLQRFAGHV